MTESEREVRQADLRLADLLLALSLATDLGMGQPMEHGFRACLVAQHLADRLGLDVGERHDIYYLALLRWVGCTAHSYELAQWFDDIDARARLFRLDVGNPAVMVRDLVRHAGAGEGLRRGYVLAQALTSAPRVVPALFVSSCEVASGLCGPLGVPAETGRLLDAVFERWDGRGVPRGLAGEKVPLAARIVQLAHVAAARFHARGVAGAIEDCRARAGMELDPELVELLAARAQVVLAGSVDADAVLDAEPGERRRLHGDEFDHALAALGDFADLVHPTFAGHSRRVAELAGAAATHLGLPENSVRTVRRAGWVQDLGRVAVSAKIWGREGTLTASEMERVRLHAYYTERILARSTALAPLGRLAGLHHERADGSGYHRGTEASAVPQEARVLAAADSYAALTADSPHRAAFGEPEVAPLLLPEVKDGRLAGEAVDAVLRAAGHRVRRRRPALPGGLTPREAEVLAAVTRGLTNRQIARQFHLSDRTVGHHVQHIYAKVGVSTRAALTLFAMQHDLLRPDMGNTADDRQADRS